MHLYGVVQRYREKAIEFGVDWYEWEYGPVENLPADPFSLAPAPQSVAQPLRSYRYPGHCNESFRRVNLCAWSLDDNGCRTWKKRWSWQVKKDCRRNSRVNWRTVTNCRRQNGTRRDCVKECRRHFKGKKHLGYRCGRW